MLEFHHPTDMIKLLDLEIPETGVTLQQLLLDCSTTLKYQVRTGKNIKYILQFLYYSKFYIKDVKICVFKVSCP